MRDEDIGVINFMDIGYPLAARLNHVQGAVVVRVKLGNDGYVVDAEAVSGAKLLIPDCLANAKKWRFSTSKGKTAIIVYWFNIDGGLCLSSLSNQFVFYPPNVVTVRSCEPVVNN